MLTCLIPLFILFSSSSSFSSFLILSVSFYAVISTRLSLLLYTTNVSIFFSLTFFLPLRTASLSPRLSFLRHELFFFFFFFFFFLFLLSFFVLVLVLVLVLFFFFLLFFSVSTTTFSRRRRRRRPPPPPPRVDGWGGAFYCSLLFLIYQ